MAPPKFIIENDDELGYCLVIGRVNYHKQLANNTDKVIGGGYWTKKEDTFIFEGSSEDFGKATERILKNV